MRAKSQFLRKKYR